MMLWPVMFGTREKGKKIYLVGFKEQHTALFDGDNGSQQYQGNHTKNQVFKRAAPWFSKTNQKNNESSYK